MNIAPFIDHTILKQTASKTEVDQLCNEALEYGFAAVCIPPVYVPQTADRLEGTAVKVATVVGFPFGYTYPGVKEKECQEALSAGAHEIDMVINVVALKNGDFKALEQEIQQVSDAMKRTNAILKVIIESGVLTEEEIIWCCAFYKNFPVHFLKTSTGYAEKGASVEAVQLMRNHLPPSISIKASGGIRDYHFAQQLINAGANRLGCSASVAIVKGSISKESDGY